MKDKEYYTVMTWLVTLAILNLYIFTQTPSEWRRDRRTRVLLLGISAIGFCAFLIMVVAFSTLNNGFFRSAILYVSTIYYSWTAVAFWIVFLRKLMFYSIRHFHDRKVMDVLGNRMFCILLSIVITAAYTTAGISNMNRLVETPYTINVEKAGPADGMTVAVVSDIHTGSGANSAILVYMKNMINKMHADVCIVAGDLFDEYTSEEDIANTCEALSDIRTVYGVIYVDGNHDDECRYEWREPLKKAGVLTLNDRAIQLDNGVAIAGVTDSSRVRAAKTDAESLVRQAGISKDAPCILVKHIPVNLKEQGRGSDIVLSGHTHGYQYPNVMLYGRLVFDNYYGMIKCGDAKCITTSGVGSWCFHAKWPSASEVVRLDIKFADR